MSDEAKAFGLVVLVLVIVGAFAVAVMDRTNTIVGSVADVDTVGYDRCGIGSFPDAKGRGNFRDPDGDARKVGEVFSGTRSWIAWFQDGESRPVTVQGAMIACGALGFSGYNHVIYRYLYSDDGISWVGFKQDRIPNAVHVFTDEDAQFLDGQEWFPAVEIIIDGTEFKACTFAVDVGSSTEGYDLADLVRCTGETPRPILDGAALRVQVLVEEGKVAKTSNRASLMAKDEVELRSAVPEVGWSKPGYKVGETARVSYRIPTDKDDAGNPAYFLRVTDENTKAALPGFDNRPLEGRSGAFDVPVTAEMFSNDLSSCQNRLRAEIWSQIIVADREDASVRANVTIAGGEAPVVTALTFDQAEYQEGEVVTVSWKVSGNVTKVHVSWHIGGLGDDVDLDGDVRSHMFVAPRTGVLEVEVTAYNRCQPSDVKKEVATVGNVYPGLCTLFPTLLQCIGTSVFALILAALAVLGILLVFVFVVWLLGKLRPVQDAIGGTGTLLLAGLAAAVAAFALLNAGVFDVLLGV